MRVKKATARPKPRSEAPTVSSGEKLTPAQRRNRVAKSIDKVLTKHAGTLAKLAR
jgi:hypothetical protein